MTPDWLLLRRYAHEDSQAAFATLTARYLNLVYAVCLREVHDPTLAQDAAQAVFLLLARTAPSFRSKTALSGWLFRTARFTAQNARTREERRRHYEEAAAKEYAAMETPAGAEVWAEIEPLLNSSLAALRETDRACLLLRFFQEQSFAEVGASLGLSEDAARKRVTRALDKLRQFFVKEGVAIPAAALAVLLTAHAAKAAPPPLAANLAVLIPGLAAGHLSAALTGSHAYQLSEGALKAMKLAQLKILASGLAAIVAFGFSAYAFSHVMSMAKLHMVPLSAAGPVHLLQQVPGKTLTASQIADRCREAYSQLRAYRVTSTVDTIGTDVDNTTRKYQTSAEIQFVRPGKIAVAGKDLRGRAFAYVSDGVGTEETFMGANNWKKARNPEMAIAGMTGIAFSAGTTVPAVLLGLKWGNPVPLGPYPQQSVQEGVLDGQLCYVLTAHTASPQRSVTNSVWIDEKTFRLRRSVSDIAGEGGKLHLDERFTNEHVNSPIPDSTFALPPAP